MCIDSTTVRLLDSVLKPEATRKLFTTIADMRIVKPDIHLDGISSEDRDSGFRDLQDANLIGVGRAEGRFYVTAKGLKVARDLGRLCVGAIR